MGASVVPEMGTWSAVPSSFPPVLSLQVLVFVNCQSPVLSKAEAWGHVVGQPPFSETHQSSKSRVLVGSWWVRLRREGQVQNWGREYLQEEPEEGNEGSPSGS